MHTSHRQSGYTLIELLLYVSVVGSLLIALSMFFATAADARVKGQTISEVNQQGTAAMEYITQTIRNADSITAPAAAGSGASLTLAVPTVALSPTIFDLSGTVLEVKEGTAAYIALTTNDLQITNLTFKNLTRSGTAGVVQVSFTITRTNPNNKNEYDYQKTFVTSAALR
jgi:type II secretory pathway pseudopilin PulG